MRRNQTVSDLVPGPDKLLWRLSRLSGSLNGPRRCPRDKTYSLKITSYPLKHWFTLSFKWFYSLRSLINERLSDRIS